MLKDFFYMGGYGSFIWSSYGIWLFAILLNYIVAHLKEKKAINNIITIYKHKKNDS